MELTWLDAAKTLPRPQSFFRGKTAPDSFRLPGSILLYYHDFPYEKTVVSSRYMLILPTVSLDYLVNGIPIRLNAGEALLIKPYLQRSVPGGGVHYDRLIVSFEAESNQEYLPDEQLLRVSPKAQEHILNLVNFYLAEHTAEALAELTLLLYELAKSPAGHCIPPLSPKLNLVLSRINQDLIRPLTVKEIAEIAGLSPSHLRLCFRREMGISLGEYLIEQRLVAAKCLLEDTTLSIGEIARQSGYQSIYAFCRFFRHRVGISPGNYRKSHDRNH